MVVLFKATLMLIHTFLVNYDKTQNEHFTVMFLRDWAYIILVIWYCWKYTRCSLCCSHWITSLSRIKTATVLITSCYGEHMVWTLQKVLCQHLQNLFSSLLQVVLFVNDFLGLREFYIIMQNWKIPVRCNSWCTDINTTYISVWIDTKLICRGK